MTRVVMDHMKVKKLDFGLTVAIIPAEGHLRRFVDVLTKQEGDLLLG